jgi:hypothetical protein
MKSLGFLLLAVLAMIFVDSNQPANNTQKTEQVIWTKDDSKTYARDQLHKWQEKQWACLNQLWSKESAWNPRAYNTIKVMGKNAGGIPQLLGLSPNTPATRQIERGLDYIYYRYITPCNAWAHFKRYGWH